MKIVIILFSIVALIIFGAFKMMKPNDKVTPVDFVNELEKLGYFKYADNSNIDKLKNDMVEYFDVDNELTTIWDDDTGVPLDYRYYSCDGETVYEEGGFTELLQDVKPTFNKIGFKINISNHLEEWDNENRWLNHSITINNTHYIIFKNFKGYGWGEAVMRFAQIINKELKKQNIDERIYLASGGNDGRLVFLTPDLYEYIYSIYKNDEWRPLEVNEWMKVNGIKSMNLD